MVGLRSMREAQRRNVPCPLRGWRPLLFAARNPVGLWSFASGHQQQGGYVYVGIHTVSLPQALAEARKRIILNLALYDRFGGRPTFATPFPAPWGSPASADSPSSPSPSSRARHGSMNSCNCCVPVRASQRRNMSSLPRGISSCGLRYAMKGLSKCTRRAPCPAYPASSSTIASSSGITPMLQSRPNRGTGSASTRLWTNCSCGPLPEGPQPTPRQGSLQPTVSCPTAITPCVRPSGCCCNHFGQHAARGGFVRFRQGPSCFLGQG